MLWDKAGTLQIRPLAPCADGHLGQVGPDQGITHITPPVNHFLAGYAVKSRMCAEPRSVAFSKGSLSFPDFLLPGKSRALLLPWMLNKPWKMFIGQVMF